MELNVIDDKKTRMVVEIKGSDHTLCNSLKTELLNDSHVKVSTYSIDHPLVGVPKMIVETDGSESPKDALIGAVSRLRKTNDKFRAEFKKEVK
tara:strand:- start:605 stop:883 length:279 start_codon:yes stop_codon:yes gene_type:complete